MTSKAALIWAIPLVAAGTIPAMAQDATSTQSRSLSASDRDPPADIIVTARRVEERLQDVPASIVVLSQQKIDDKNIRSILDLATFAPSLQVNTRFGAKNATFSLRGFSQASRTASSVGVYFADVVAPRGGNGSTPAGDGAGPGSFFDLENVQVLNGPQGTLFGRNTTGGAVILVPKKPVDKFEAYVEGSYGNYNYKRLQGVLNVPINDMARLRIGADFLDRNGFLRNLSPLGAPRMGDQSYFAARASLVLDLTPDLENYTVATYSVAEDTGSIAKITDCTRTAAEPNGTFPLGLLACQQLARSAGQGFYVVESSFRNPVSRNVQWQAINTTTWKLSDSVTLKNIVAYSQLRTFIEADITGSNIVIPSGAFGVFPTTGALAGTTYPYTGIIHAPGTNNADQQNIVEELRLQGTAGDGRLNWQGGLYYEASSPRRALGVQAPTGITCTDVATFQCTDPLAAIGNLPTSPRNAAGTNALTRSFGSISSQRAEVFFLNRAVYGQATYALFDNLKLTGGLRYTWDKSRGIAQIRAVRITNSTGVPTAPTATCTLRGVTGDCRTDVTQRSQAPTWLVGLDYNPAEDILLYGKYSRGYRQGSVSFNVPVLYQIVGPEKVDTYEIGAKTSFSGAVSGTFNVAAFYNNLQNQQIGVNLATSNNSITPTTTNLNAGKSEIAGFEVDASIRILPGLTIDGNLEHLRTKVKSLDVLNLPAEYNVVTPSATLGSVLPFVPKWKWNLGATYRLPVADEVGKITASATYSHSDSYVFTTGPYGVIDSVGLVSANLNWNGFLGSQVDLSVFGTNLTGQKYYTGVNDVSGSAGLVTKYVGEPRTFGVRMRINYGN